jgi:isopenicillin N synthase-like dioxygenase
LPGKALIILQEAAQRRGFIRLTKAGLQAVNMSYGIKELRELFKCDSSQEDVEILQVYH